MPKTVGFRGFFLTVFLLGLFRADFARAEGYFRLVLIDGTVVEGEMIRVTPATIEINPDGPEEFASYNQSVISDIIYTKQKPGRGPKTESLPGKKDKSDAKGFMAVKYNIREHNHSGDNSGLIHNYVMIDGKLYFAGFCQDFIIELPSGKHTLELCGVNLAYYEPTDFYSLENGGTVPRIWRQDNPFVSGRSLNIYIRGDSATVITLQRRNRDYLFVYGRESGIMSKGDFLLENQITFRMLYMENGIIPGKLVFEELPKNYVFHDSLEYHYSFVFHESQWGRFNDAAYLPGNYVIEARTIAWNRWKDRCIGETLSRCEMEIKSGHTTMVKFQSYINHLDCEVTMLPDRWFEISTRQMND